MGLLLSVLITCVGVLEVIACYTHLTIGTAYNECKSNLRDVAKYYAVELRKHELHFEPGPNDTEPSTSHLSELIKKRSIRTQEISVTPDQGTPNLAANLKVPRNSICGYDSPTVQTLLTPELDITEACEKIQNLDQNRKSLSPYPDRTGLEVVQKDFWRSRSPSPFPDSGIDNSNVTPFWTKPDMLTQESWESTDLEVQNILERQQSPLLFNLAETEAETQFDEAFLRSLDGVNKSSDDRRRNYRKKRNSSSTSSRASEITPLDEIETKSETKISPLTEEENIDVTYNGHQVKTEIITPEKFGYITSTRNQEANVTKQPEILFKATTQQESSEKPKTFTEKINDLEISVQLLVTVKGTNQGDKLQYTTTVNPDKSPKPVVPTEEVTKSTEETSEFGKVKTSVTYGSSTTPETQNLKDLQISSQSLIHAERTKQDDVATSEAEFLKLFETYTELPDRQKNEFLKIIGHPKPENIEDISPELSLNKINKTDIEVGDQGGNEIEKKKGESIEEKQSKEDLQLKGKEIVAMGTKKIVDINESHKEEIIKRSDNENIDNLVQSLDEYLVKRKEEILPELNRNSTKLVTQTEEVKTNEHQTICQNTESPISNNKTTLETVNTRSESLKVKEELRTNEHQTMCQNEEMPTSKDKTTLETTDISKQLTKSESQETMCQNEELPTCKSKTTLETVDISRQLTKPETQTEEVKTNEHQIICQNEGTPTCKNENTPETAEQSEQLIKSENGSSKIKEELIICQNKEIPTPKNETTPETVEIKQTNESSTKSEDETSLEASSNHHQMRRASQTSFEDATSVQHQEMLRRRVSTSEPSPKQASQAFWLIFSAEYTNAMEKDWHGQHFSCWQCDESLTGQRYVLRDDHPYCVKCYEQVFANPCEKCNRIIGIDSKDLSYKDKHWHEACFQCTTCNESLVDKQFGAKGEKIYCGNCYDKQFASRCDGCGKIFHAGTKKMEYKNRQWHEQCFKCCKCETPIGTKSFIPREKDIYCAGCYEEKFATRCVKCDKAIQSGGVTYKNEPWHRECFTCTHCNKNLAGQRFTSRDDKPCCAECFGRLFAKRCTSCSDPITGIGGTRFISFEDRHWHNDCFICATCSTSLVGRGFITDEDKIICPECAKERFM